MENINITRLFPGWRIVRMIGRGSFGTVYEIAKERLGETEKAALKVISIPNESGVIDELRLEGYDDASIKKRFESDLGSFVKEYKNMRMLTHTNIVNCDDIEYEESADGVGYTMYIKMELLTPLMSVINKSTDVEKLALDLAKDICSALVLCESRNVVHRDIKPWNLFVNEYGEYKLGDFGIARQMDHTTNATRTGTYKYMAPEVYNNKPYGHNVDIYSLGLVLYWILNDKRLPFLPLPPAIPTAHQEEEARATRMRGDRLPAPKRGSQHLKSIVLKACEADPKYRYQTASEMLKDLQSADNESPDFSVSGVSHGAPVENKVNGGTNNNGTQREYSSFDDYYTKNGQADYTDSTMGNAWSDGEKTSAAQTSYGSYSANNQSNYTDRTMGNSWNDGGKTEAKPRASRSTPPGNPGYNYSSSNTDNGDKTVGVKTDYNGSMPRKDVNRAKDAGFRSVNTSKPTDTPKYSRGIKFCHGVFWFFAIGFGLFFIIAFIEQLVTGKFFSKEYFLGIKGFGAFALSGGVFVFIPIIALFNRKRMPAGLKVFLVIFLFATYLVSVITADQAKKSNSENESSFKSTSQENKSTNNSSVRGKITTIDSYSVGQRTNNNVGVIMNATQASWLYEDDAWSAYPYYLLNGVTIASDMTKDADSPDGDYIFKVKIDNK